MATKSGSDTAAYVANYLKAQDASSDEETEALELLECGDFDSFMPHIVNAKRSYQRRRNRNFCIKLNAK